MPAGKKQPENVAARKYRLKKIGQYGHGRNPRAAAGEGGSWGDDGQRSINASERAPPLRAAQSRSVQRAAKSLGPDSGRADFIMSILRGRSRVLAREKGFSSIAIATLALGIGAVTSIFSVVNAVLLKPLTYSDAGRLYAATESSPKLAHLYPKVR